MSGYAAKKQLMDNFGSGGYDKKAYYDSTKFSEHLSARTLDQNFGVNQIKDLFSRPLSDIYGVDWAGPYDHGGDQPSEYFMPYYIPPHKLRRLAKFTTIGYRIIYEFSSDVWNNGLAIKLLGEAVEEENDKINHVVREHFKKLNFYESWEKLTAFAREQGDSLMVNTYAGEVATDNDWSFLKEPAPDSFITKITPYNRVNFHIAETGDDGGVELFNVSIYLGDSKGWQSIPIHHTRCIWLRKGDIDNSYISHGDLRPCYNEVIILTNILKAAGKAAFTWSTGHPVILTKGYGPAQMDEVKKLIGDPTSQSWHILPSEMIEYFDMISQKMSMLDLPALADFVINLIITSVGIPRPILMGEVAGVVTGGEVNERTYFALLDKEHSNIEPCLYEYILKDKFLRGLLAGKMFVFDWGIRQSMSLMDQIDIESKTINNVLAEMQYKTYNESRHERGLKPLIESVEPEFKEYAKIIGNSIGAFTIFDMMFEKQKMEQAKQVGLGNDQKGKGAGTKWGEGSTSKIKKPGTVRKSKAEAMSSVRNKVARDIQGLIDWRETERPEAERFNIKEICDGFNIHKNTLYKLLDGVKA